MSDTAAAARAKWLARVLGVELPSGAEGTPSAAEVTQRIAGLAPAVTAVAAAAGDTTSLRLKLDEAAELGRAGDAAGAKVLLDRLEATLNAPPGARQATPGPRPDAPLQVWQAARDTAVKTLRMLEVAMRQSTSPHRDPAIILVGAVRANLTPRPETLAQVDELVRYIDGDGIVAAAETPNVFGITVALRAPLLTALRGLRTQLAAAEGTG